ncbi:putative RDD family membrane protein YckC [Roseibium hamelinense]|uniref:Putative RDD family membrane protein YckC n=1 Tax=Roseibium hamelinense TaxID=150831 RepID=A0A562TI90_9HYPH|nr:RDD family protein [Roseibium hamelinense]MTI42391.1 RDD family protein [Roseibium hamelinense]TWI92596.1 putative RDD family membrane protein YckC [Roseibium hamelinense]
MSADYSSTEGRQNVFDPAIRPDLYEGVRTRRIFAFFFDAIFITILIALAAIIVGFMGIFTLGLAWFAYLFLGQAVALLYVAFTLGGPNAATPGMRAMGLEMRLWYGARPYPLLAVMHALIFWFSVSLLTPFILLVSLFSDRKRLLHDIVLGTVVVNSAALDR